MATVREQIITNLANGLSNITVANGYDNTIVEVRKGIVNSSTINTFPILTVQQGSEVLQTQIEGQQEGIYSIDCFVIGYTQTNDITSSVESLISDIKRFFYKDQNLSISVVCSLLDIVYIQGYEIKEINPYLAYTNNICSFGILLKIEYVDFVDPTTPIVLVAPTLVSPVNESTDGETFQALNWNSVADAQFYHIRVYDDNGILTIDQDNLTNTSFTIPDDIIFNNGDVITWNVRAKAGNVYSDWSETWSYTINEETLPANPTLVSPLASTEVLVTVDFVWDISARSDSYDFQLSTAANFATTLVDTNLAHTTYEYTFSSNATYYWRVRGKNSSGVSAWVSSSVIVNLVGSETIALASRHTVKPNGQRQVYMDTLIQALKTANIWNKLDVLQIYESHSITNNDWGLNWKGNYCNAISSATSVGLTINSPVTTNGTSSYIRTGFNAATQSIAYTQNLASLGLKNTNTNDGRDDIYLNAGAGGYFTLWTKYTGNFYGRLNTIGGQLMSGVQTKPDAFHIMTRSNSTSTFFYRDGSLVYDGTGAQGQNSGTIPNIEIKIGLGEVGFKAASYCVFFAGGLLNSTEVSTITTTINTYLTNIGGVV